jgi:hypothetical protein
MAGLMKVAFSLAVLAAPALAQSVPRPDPPPATDQARKDQAQEPGAKGNQPRDKQPRPRENDHPAIGPQTTQGLAQDAIARSNSR